MSTKKKTAGKTASTGIRYSDALKQEVVDFVEQYNSEKGRGGQSAAARKFNITPLTIATWLKSSGVKKPAKKAAKKAAKKTAKKAAKKTAGKANKANKATKKGVRYSDDFKKEVVDFVKDYNETEGRGGQNRAAKKYNLSVLTVSSWLKAAGVQNPRRKPLAKKAAKTAKKAKKAARKVAKKAKNGAQSELESLKAAIRKLVS